MPEPIIYGRMNDFRTGDATDDVTGVTVTATAQPTAAPTGVTATAVAGGTAHDAFTMFYRVGAIVSGDESDLSAVVSAVTTSANKTIRVAWNAVGSATSYRLYKSHRSDFRQFDYADVGNVTTYDDTYVDNLPEEIAGRYKETAWYLGLRLNVRVYVFAKTGATTWSLPGEAELIITPHSWTSRTYRLTASWSAYTGATGYRVIIYHDEYNAWNPVWHKQQDVSATVLSLAMTFMIDPSDIATVEVPGSATAPERISGAVPALHVGTETIAGATWQRLLVAGHACKAIENIYVQAQGASQQGTNDAETLHRLPDSEYNVNWHAPGKTGWPFADVYRDIGARRYTLIYTKMSPPPEVVLVNVQGIEATGDGTGALLTDLLDQYKHFMLNYVYRDYLTGAWATTSPAFDDDATKDQIDLTSFDTAGAVADTRLNGGYVAAWALGIGGTVGLREAIARLNISADVDAGFNRHCQFLVVMMEDDSPTSATEFDDIHDIIEGTFEVREQVEDLANVLPYAYRFDHRLSRFVYGEDGNLEVTDADSIADYDSNAFSGEFVAQQVRLYCVRDATIAEDVVRRRLTRLKEPPRLVSWLTGLQGLSVELGDIVWVTHPEGVGAAGWTDRPIRIMRHEVNPADFSVRLEGWDVDRFFSDAFILGDEATLPAAWTSTTTAQKRYGYLCDETTKLFSDSARGKRLR